MRSYICTYIELRDFQKTLDSTETSPALPFTTY